MLFRKLGSFALGVASLIALDLDASAGIFGRGASYTCATYCWPTSPARYCYPFVHCAPEYVKPHYHVVQPHTLELRVVDQEQPSRQVRVTYFNSKYSAWFETDAMVCHKNAGIGLSVNVDVAGVGHVRGWVVAVYTQPRLQSPYGVQSQEAVKAPAHVSLKASEAPRALVSSTTPSHKLSGCTRLWTNKQGDRHAVAELVSVNDDSITVKTPEGKVVEQSFGNLSDADVKFVRTAANSQMTESIAREIN